MTHCTDIDAMLQDLFEDNEGEIQQGGCQMDWLLLSPAWVVLQQQPLLLAGWQPSPEQWCHPLQCHPAYLD